MKKFLSLLLALTLVLSLVVVPARAATGSGEGEGSGSGGSSGATPSATLTWSANPTITVTSSGTTVSSVTKGASLTFAVEPLTVTKADGSAATLNTDYTVSYSWSNLPGGLTAANRGSITGTTNTAGTFSNVTCAVTVTTKPAEGEGVVVATKNANASVTVNDLVFSASDIASISYKGRVCTLSGSTVSAPYFTASENATLSQAAGDWVVTLKSTSPFKLKSAVYNGTKLTVTETGDSYFDLTVTPNALTPNFTATPSSNTIGKNASVTLSASQYSREGVTPTYAWTYGTNNAPIGNGASLTWKPVVASGATYPVTIAVKCTAYEGSVKTAERSFNIQVTEDDYVVTLPAVGKLPTNAANIFTLVPGTAAGSNFQFYKNDANKTHITSNVTYTYSSSAPSVATISSDGKISTLAAGSTNITITATYNGAAYTRTFAVQVVNPTYTLGSTYCGYNNSVYSAATLKTYANNALTTAGITGVTADSVALASASSNVVATGTAATGYTLAASPTYLGTANLTATVTKTGGGTFTMTFKVPVLPIPYSTSLGTVNAEPYTTGSTYYNNTYRVTLPTTFNQYYVVSKNTTPNYNVSAAPTSGVTTVTLNQNEFVNGQCTLYVIAWNSNYNGYGYGYNYGKYYSGAITVTQTNYNIQYNGVAGETVQFAQSDFTDFMNEVAEARGDASKTKSYPYVTFDYVTFSLPTTAQGTLYYGGTAMSTSNSSGAFNRNTKVPNLDSVTFVPNAKTTAKTITLNFTLYATRYSSSSTSHGTTVPYSGTVVVNLVREDIKYTVSQGDSVRFDESDFLSYLRSTKGYTSNYTIDYVTFDQSAVSAVNEGSLYTYYNGYNYGGSVKTTDRFYYNATASQNALSDVAFLASRYAKTGETVYIPFTIYARYGSTGTGTRQLTGTVAIKIGQTMNFIDVKTTDYFYNSVKWAVGKNITNGTSSTTFSPYKSCTRAEIVTFLWRAAGSPEPTITRNPFRDVNAVTHSSYYKAILWASQKGITSGTSATAFSPDQVCTRAQIVTFLYRYAGQPSGYYSNPFKDVGATSEASYYNAILWAVGKGITTGTSATTFSPYASCNRAEAVTFLYRYTNGL